MEFLKERVFNNISFGKVWWSSRNPIITLYTLGGCGGLERNSFLTVCHFGRDVDGLERNSFLTVSPLGGCGGLQRTEFFQFPL